MPPKAFKSDSRTMDFTLHGTTYHLMFSVLLAGAILTRCITQSSPLKQFVADCVAAGSRCSSNREPPAVAVNSGVVNSNDVLKAGIDFISVPSLKLCLKDIRPHPTKLQQTNVSLRRTLCLISGCFGLQ